MRARDCCEGGEAVFRESYVRKDIDWRGDYMLALEALEHICFVRERKLRKTLAFNTWTVKMEVFSLFKINIFNLLSVIVGYHRNLELFSSISLTAVTQSLHNLMTYYLQQPGKNIKISISISPQAISQEKNCLIGYKLQCSCFSYKSANNNNNKNHRNFSFCALIWSKFTNSLT